jgi:hypothetical protein
MVNNEDGPSEREGHDTLNPASFSLRQEHLGQLRALAERYGVSQSQVLRDALDLAFAYWNDQALTDRVVRTVATDSTDDG